MTQPHGTGAMAAVAGATSQGIPPDRHSDKSVHGGARPPPIAETWQAANRRLEHQREQHRLHTW